MNKEYLIKCVTFFKGYYTSGNDITFLTQPDFLGNIMTEKPISGFYEKVERIFLFLSDP